MTATHDRDTRGRPRSQHRLRVGVRIGLVAMAIIALGYALYTAGCFLPTWTQWDECAIEANLDDEGEDERFVLERRRVSVMTDAGGPSSHLVYESPRDWMVFGMACADLDSNGSVELILALWKRGTLGTSRAIWETNPLERWHPWFAQHLYVYTWRDGELVPFWMGGDLDAHVASMYVDDEARVHLVTLEGDDTSWSWEGWGFTASD